MIAFAPLPARAQPFDCSSADPSDWPPPAKPYFMLAVDTSGSMTAGVNANNSCAYPNNRLGHGRCAIRNTVQAFSGQAHFGLATFARRMTSCSGNQTTCQFTDANGNGLCSYQNLPLNSSGDLNNPYNAPGTTC
ncbi:MAG TPA: VWA domain-containing protein, partial [Candidatus Nanopelagicales bacterium]|nr:VWA domain-containing protein [Candidatus Nanopelagicales bacterium]